MTSATQCLQPSDIEALLSGTVPASQSESWEEHFSSCESCRMAMASQVGDQAWWREAEQSLKGESIPDVRDAVKSEADERESIEELLKLLGPTDDPRMTGRIGTYEVLGILGRGGMGVVFKAFDAPLNRFVAIKMLLPHLAASGAARKRFAREGQAVAAVVDDHVMAIHCVDEWQGVPYLVMTYSRGVSLQKRLSDNGPLEVREILRIGMQAAKGLAAAHAQGIVHRDIKPANIFLDQTVERVQLMDFGLARAVDDASLTRSGTLAGTPQYMSPEQARAEAVDHRSDLFSLGSVMYAMCTGHAPFRAESSYSVLRLITDKEPRPIQELNSDIPEWLCRIVNKLMAKQASDRFELSQDIAELLEDCLAHVQQPAAMPLPAQVAALAPKITRRPPIGKFIAAAAGACALFFAGILIVLELGKGTLTIESEMDNVPIRIVQRGEVVERLTVTKSGNSVRVAAGTYVVELETKLDGMVVENDYVSLKRGGTEHVMIRLSTQDSNVKAGIANQSAMESTDSVATFSAPGERAKIMVDVYGGNRVLGQNNAKYAKLVQDLNAIDGVQVNFREAGPGNEIAMVIVRDLTGLLNQEVLTTGKPSARRDAMSKALAQITDVRWEEDGQTSVPPEDGTVPQAVKVNLRFSETREVVLSMGTLQCMLDLDTGETCPAPARMSDDLNKFDLKPMQDQPQEEPRGLKIQSQDATMSFDAFAVASELWDLQESKVLSALATDKLIHVREIPLRDGTQNTYFFRTSPGTRGLLQLVGSERIGGDIDAPWGIRIRYKTLRSVDPAREANAANNSRDSGLDGKQKGASKPKRLQIREANVVDASADSSQPSVESQVVEFSGMRLRLDTAQPAILTEDDIMTVESVTDPNKLKASQIVLTLMPEAGERFLIETTRLSSQPNPGYLVIEFDGTVLSAPRVNDKISNKVAISASKDDEMETLVAAIRESIAAREKVAKKEPDARSVVEAYVASALAGDVAKAAALAKNSPADPKHIRELPEFLNVQRLKIDTVCINDPAKPTWALATSAAVKLDEEHKQPDGQREGFMVFTLELTDDKWFVIDIDFESESGAEKELKRFLEANPNSIGLPPLMSSSMPNPNPAADPADDHDRLQGAWQSLDSKKLPVMPGGRNQFSVSFLADRMAISGPQRAGIGTFSLSPDTVPKQIDCRLTFGDQHIELKGIYEFRDSKLWLCLTEGGQRPKSFDNQPDVAGLMILNLERNDVELPGVDSNASLALSDWSQSQNGAGVFATYTLSIPGIETISQGLAAGGPAAKEFAGVPGFPGKVFTLRYFLPNLSPRGMAFVAGTSFESSLNLIELAQVAEHKRLVRVFSYPDSATGASDPIGAVPVDRPVETPEVEPKEANLTISVLKAGANQADWLKEIDATGEIIYGYEVVVKINDGAAFDRDAAFRWQDGKLTVSNPKPSKVDESKTPALD